MAIAITLFVLGAGAISYDIILRFPNTDFLKSIFTEIKITDAVTAIFTIVLAVATIQLARSTEVLAEDTRRNWREKEISTAMEASRVALDRLRKLRSITPGDQYDPTEFSETLNELERLASLIKVGVINEQIVSAVASGAIIQAYLLLEPEITRRRQRSSNPRLYQEIEALVKKWRHEERGTNYL